VTPQAAIAFSVLGSASPEGSTARILSHWGYNTIRTCSRRHRQRTGQ